MFMRMRVNEVRWFSLSVCFVNVFLDCAQSAVQRCAHICVHRSFVSFTAPSRRPSSPRLPVSHTSPCVRDFGVARPSKQLY